jgi:hypothetical protein
MALLREIREMIQNAAKMRDLACPCTPAAPSPLNVIVQLIA